MSQKFFSLIFGGEIHQAPKSKIIPQKEFSSLMDAKELLDHVKEDAKKFKIQVASEIEKQKEAASKMGFEEGYAKWAKQLAFLEEELERAKLEFQKNVIPIALKAAKKILGKEVELKEETVVDIVLNSLKAVSQHKKIVIYVCKKDLDILESQRPRIKSFFENIESLSIQEKSEITSGGCIIETEGGIINAQLENQWNALEQAFETLMKRKENL